MTRTVPPLENGGEDETDSDIEEDGQPTLVQLRGCAPVEQFFPCPLVFAGCRHKGFSSISGWLRSHISSCWRKLIGECSNAEFDRMFETYARGGGASAEPYKTVFEQQQDDI